MNLRNFVVAAAGLAIIAGCSQSVGPKDDISDQYSIYLAGRVLDEGSSNPVAGVVARLAGRNLSDTTDANGWYLITERKAGSLGKAVSVADSVEIKKDGQLITYLGVPAWIDTLPDVFLVQHNIGGSFLAEPNAFGRVVATVTVGSDPAPRTVLLWYNQPVQQYSGFVYVVYEVNQNYSLYVSVYNTDSALTGRSAALQFPYYAGIITVSAFDPNNAMPRISGVIDTAVSINDTVRLHAAAADSFGGAIAKWEWGINGGGFNQTSTGDTIIIAPATEVANYSCVVRVTDNDGLCTTDTLVVSVVLDMPAANAGNDSAVAKSSQVTLHGSASQQFGSIVKWEWDIGNSGFVQTSTGDTTVTTPDSAISVYPCVLKVTDDDGNDAEDTVNLQVGVPAPTLVRPFDGNDTVNSMYTIFEWNAAAGATRYWIQVSSIPDFSALVVNDSTFSTYYYGDSLIVASGTAYYWRVKAGINTSGIWSDWSQVWSFTTIQPLELVQPVGGETWLAGDPVPILWKINDRTKLSSIVVSLSLDSGKTFTAMFGYSFDLDSTSVQWISNSTQVSDQCIIRVSDYIDGSIQDRSGVFSVLSSTLPPVIISGPTSLTVVEGDTVTYSLTVAGSPPMIYKWQRSNDTGTTWFDISGGTNPVIVSAVVLSDNGAYFRVIVTNTAGSDTSNVAILTVLPAPPQPPVLLSPADGATGVSVTPTLTWNASTGVFSNYYVQISTVSDFSSTVGTYYVMPSDTSYTVAPALNASATYYWRVMADGIYSSTWSAVWSFTTLP
jgi:hypothetical protein